jgi:MFS family permease
MSAIAMASYNNLSATAALPAIGDDLGRVTLLPWVVTVELVAAAVAVLAVGPYIDGAGARRTFRITVVSFLVSSALCASAPTMELLIAGRVLQGLAAGALIGTSLTCIGLVFDDAVRPWAFALMSSVWGIMGIGGPALAAVLVSTLGWRAVFAANLPVALAAAAVGWSRLPAEGRAAAEPMDRRGLLVLSAFTVVLLMATSDVRWYSLVLVALGGVLAALYVVHARGYGSPVVRLSHVVASRWRNLHVVGVVAVAGGTGASVYLPLYLKAARGSSVAFAAFAVIWPTLGWSIAAWVSGKLQQHLRAQTVTLIGSAFMSVGAVSATVAAAFDAPMALLLAAFVCAGWGIGTISTASLALLQSRASLQEMGRVSSAHHFIRSLGFAYGAAVAGLVMFWVVDRRTGDAELVRGLLSEAEAAVDATVAEALASAYTWSLGAMAVLSVLTVPAAVVLARGRDREMDGTGHGSSGERR